MPIRLSYALANAPVLSLMLPFGSKSHLSRNIISTLPLTSPFSFITFEITARCIGGFSIICVRILLSGNCHEISADCAFDIHEVLRRLSQNETFAHASRGAYEESFPKGLRRVAFRIEKKMYHNLRNNIKKD